MGRIALCGVTETNCWLDGNSFSLKIPRVLDFSVSQKLFNHLSNKLFSWAIQNDTFKKKNIWINNLIFHKVICFDFKHVYYKYVREIES